MGKEMVIAKESAKNTNSRWKMQYFLLKNLNYYFLMHMSVMNCNATMMMSSWRQPKTNSGFDKIGGIG
jgi:hypothetical protein